MGYLPTDINPSDVTTTMDMMNLNNQTNEAILENYNNIETLKNSVEDLKNIYDNCVRFVAPEDSLPETSFNNACWFILKD